MPGDVDAPPLVAVPGVTGLGSVAVGGLVFDPGSAAGALGLEVPVPVALVGSDIPVLAASLAGVAGLLAGVVELDEKDPVFGPAFVAVEPGPEAPIAGGLFDTDAPGFAASPVGAAGLPAAVGEIGDGVGDGAGVAPADGENEDATPSPAG